MRTEKEKPAVRIKNSDTTKQHIFDAAKRLFSEHRFEDVSLRSIAADAGIDVALIGRYFGSKEGLFRTVIKEVMTADLFIQMDRASFGKQIAKILLSGEAGSQEISTMMLIMHAVTSKKARPILRDISSASYARSMEEWLGGENADIRAHFIASLTGGAAIYRELLPPTLATKRGMKRYEEALAKMLQSLVNG